MKKKQKIPLIVHRINPRYIPIKVEFEKAGHSKEFGTPQLSNLEEQVSLVFF